mmetsp:Transcript_86664/g.197788  ORF Transcript_86664/g.197788 Transcript_86664/m.197788 type:complete len:427 (+) Transcript_86664:395-1675(+)
MSRGIACCSVHLSLPRILLLPLHCCPGTNTRVHLCCKRWLWENQSSTMQCRLFCLILSRRDILASIPTIGTVLPLFFAGILDFCWILFASCAVGFAAGGSCSMIFKKAAHLPSFPAYEIAIMALVAYFTFSISSLLGLSGIVSLFFCSAALAHYGYYNLSEYSQTTSKLLFRTVALLAEYFVFAWCGVVSCFAIGRFHGDFFMVVGSLVLIVVARAMNVFPLSFVLNQCRQHNPIPMNYQMLMWFSGLRGVIAFALVMRVPRRPHWRPDTDPLHQNRDLIVTVTISTVVLSTILVGSSMETVAKRLGAIADSRTMSAEFAGESSDEMLSYVDFHSNERARLHALDPAASRFEQAIGSCDMSERRPIAARIVAWDRDVLQDMLGGFHHPRRHFLPEAKTEAFCPPEFVREPAPSDPAPEMSRAAVFE